MYLRNCGAALLLTWRAALSPGASSLTTSLDKFIRHSPLSPACVSRGNATASAGRFKLRKPGMTRSDVVVVKGVADGIWLDARSSAFCHGEGSLSAECRGASPGQQVSIRTVFNTRFTQLHLHAAAPRTMRYVRGALHA